MQILSWNRALNFCLGVGLLASVVAYSQGTDYTVCRVEKADKPEEWPARCFDPLSPGDGSDPSIPLTVTKVAGTELVVSVPAQNCRQREDKLYGTVQLVVDNSKSLITTDPNNDRLSAAVSLIDSLASRAANSGLAESDPSAPKLGLLSYGGRQGFSDGYESDRYNQKLIEEFCLNGDGTTGMANKPLVKFDSPEARERYNQKDSAGNLISFCEGLSPVSLTKLTGSASEPSVDRLKSFLTTSGTLPRGSTDLTYFFQGMVQSNNLKAVPFGAAKNAIVITDGLPNLPRYVPEAKCKSTSYLKDEPISVIKDQDGFSQKVCVYRRAQEAIDNVNAYVEGKSVFVPGRNENIDSGKEFRDINVYNVLFAPDNQVYYDLDTKGQINPPDFLIENSARSGNGKVKFKWAKNKDELISYVSDVIINKFDKASLRRVTVQVGSNPEYNAVSPADTASSKQMFSIKFIGLNTGYNRVNVNYYYADSGAAYGTRVFEVTVNETGTSTTAPFTCSGQSYSRTVDGDDPASFDPKGDGVLPKPKPDGSQDRVFRNADESNGYDRSRLRPASGVAAPVLPGVAIEKAPLNPRDLKLQSGVGNCGSLASTQVAGVQNTNSKGLVKWFALFLLLLPMFNLLPFLIALVKKKWQILSLISFIFLVQPTNARADGLNSENFSANVDNKSSLMWETARTIKSGSLLWAYTFSYALRPVEFGDGKSQRLRVVDHLQVNHLGLGYGLTTWFDLGLNVPFALHSKPDSQKGFIKNVGVSRSWFFLSDPRLRAKFNLFPGKKGQGFFAGLLISVSLPFGSKEAMLSDGTSKLTLEIPLHYAMPFGFEAFFTPGFASWGDSTRLKSQGDSAADEDKLLLRKETSVLLNAGLRQWIIGDGTRSGNLQWEAGLRGDFSGQKITLGNSESPVEWALGAALWSSSALSWHAAYGTGLGRGVTGPLSRLVAGLRYLTPSEEATQAKAKNETATSVSYSDQELDQIFAEAQREILPEDIADEETMLRLMTESEVIDIGTINFEFDSAKLTEKALKTIQKLYDQLLRLNPKSIKIDGHTDSIGSYSYNLALSKRRADSVRKALVDLGVEKGILATEGFAYKYPLVSNGTKAGRNKNRRIEVALDGRSFRQATYTKEETQVFQRWIYPGGKKPNKKSNVEN